MDAQHFMAEFGHIANAPGGVARLRQMILAMAARGDLLKNSTNLKECQLEDIGDWAIGSGFPKQEQGLEGEEVLFSKVSDMNLPGNEKFIETTVNTISFETAKRIKAKIHPAGTVIFPKIGGAIATNKRRILLKPTAIDNNCLGITPKENISSEWLFLVLSSIDFSRYQAGTSVPALSQKTLEKIKCAELTSDEQSRIVAKVDELMALCDQLEAQQQKRRTLQNHLRQATLQAVAASQSPRELQDSWQRLEANFGKFFSAPEDVEAFKGLILDLATSGYLSNIEHRHSSTGKQLLEVITQRRVAWSHEAEGQEKKEAQAMFKKLRTQRVSLPEAALPEHWTWATFLQVSQAVVDCHNKTAPYVGSGIHLVRTTDIRNGEMNLTNTKKITEETFSYWAKRMPPKAGDIFFTREAPMGEAAIVPEGEKVCLGQRTMLIRLFPELFNNRFLLYVIRSPSFQTRMIEAAIGMTVKHLRVGGVEDLVVPVPPKQEQDSIVATIDSLFEICDRFETQLSKKQRVAANLASSSVASLTGITIEQKEEPMKAPQTELVAPVRLGTPPDIKAQAPLATLLVRHNGEMSANDLWQRFGGEIDTFYAQLKTEVAQGWLQEPKPAEMREKAES